MQTFNDEKKKRENGVAQPVTTEQVQTQLANKANPTVTGGAAVPTVAPKTSAIPGVKVHSNAPAMIGNYAFDTDFMAERQKAEAEGDYGKAALMEFYRNQKLGYMTSPYRTTDVYNYTDPYRGELDRMQEDMQNREKFSYDYRDDEQYKAIKRLKEKEAQDAFDDAYGRLSAQFDGDIPVNMMNKLYDTKADIIDSADSYIPQLQQLAYSMYMDEGDMMMRNYALMQERANQDYNRWAEKRDLHVSGLDNKYGRDASEKAYNEDIRRYNQEYADKRADIEYERDNNEQQRTTGLTQTDYENRYQATLAIMESEGVSFDEAWKRASGYVPKF
ncbi:MAG: hypothetical protein IJX50_00295 [Clostridia bacterium]|nr:hypothetical protein [Clostridia bacterium]